MKSETITDAMIGRYLSGEASDRERVLLRAHLKCDPTLIDRIYLEAEREAELRRFFGQVVKRQASARRNPSHRLRWPLLPLAAAAAAVIGVGLYLLAAPWVDMTASMTLAETSGEATIARGSRTRSARVGMRLRAGDVVRAGADGFAMLTHAETESTVRVLAESALSLTRVPDRIFLAHGAVDVETASRSGRSPLKVETTRAKASVTGTRFEMTARPELTQLAVRNGAVDFMDIARNVSISVPAGHWSMVAPGADPQIAPLGADLPANYSWDFSEPPDPAIFKVFRGAWWHNPEEQCMETEGDDFKALINLPLHGLPLEIEIEQTTLSRLMNKDQTPVISLGTFYFDRTDQGEAVLNLHTRSVRGIGDPVLPQWTPPTVSRFYISPSFIARTDEGRHLENVFFSRPGHKNNRLVFFMKLGPSRLHRINIRSVRSEDVPDVSVFRQAINALPTEKRRGFLVGPDPRPGRQDRDVGWFFPPEGPSKMSPFEYVDPAPPGASVAP